VNAFRKLLQFWPWLAAIFSGVLCTLCFPPFNQNWLCWIALTPLIAAVWFSGRNSARRWLRNLLLGYVTGVVFFTGTFSWLGSLGSLFDSFWLKGLPLLLSLYLGVHLAFWSWFIGLIAPTDFLSSRRNLQTAFCGASAWVVHEWTRGWLFGGFGWNGLGVALHANWPLIQIAEFTGVTGLSFAIAFVNIIAVTAPLRFSVEARTRRMRPHFDLTLTMVGIVGLFTFGIQSVRSPPVTNPLRVAAVQANIPQREKFDPKYFDVVKQKLDYLGSLAHQANFTPELIAYPESSIPGTFEGYDTVQLLGAMAEDPGVDIIAGIIDEKEDHAYNAAVFVSRNGEMQIYRKIHLVPFGEYIPLRHSFPLFAAVASKWVPGDFEAGQDYTVFRLTNQDVHVAPLVCFEDTIGELTRKFVLAGASLLVDVTNDGWFLHSAGSQQHLANAIFRCVETRRPMIRAANTGVTCFVNDFGRVTQLLRDETGSTFTEGVLTGEIGVPIEHELTFYTRHGELFAKVCTYVTLIAIGGTVTLRGWRRRGGSRVPPRDVKYSAKGA
jgi:apolipoprotein N-acyltransferase